MYNIRFSLNDGEAVYTIAQEIRFDEILEVIYDHIKLRYPNWNWTEEESGWADVGIHSDGKTYIRIRGVGDVYKGQTYYIIERSS